MVLGNHHAVANGDMLGGGDERLPLPKEWWAREAILKGIELRRREAGFAESICSQLFEYIGNNVFKPFRFRRVKKHFTVPAVVAK
jgi:hypothetical protein